MLYYTDIKCNLRCKCKQCAILEYCEKACTMCKKDNKRQGTTYCSDYVKKGK